MSKENQNNTPYESSIKPPAEGVEAAQENNTKLLQLSINTPIKPLENPQEVKEPEIPKQSKTRRTLEDTKSLYAARAARVGAAAVIVGVAGVKALGQGTKAAGKIVSGDIITGTQDAVEAGITLASDLAKAVDPVDKLQQKGKIKEKGPESPGIYDKVLDKVKTLPGGVPVANAIDKTYNTLSSKAVKRGAKITGAVVSLAVNPTPIGLGIAALSLTSVAYGVVKETLEVREDKHLDNEKKSLEAIKHNKQEQIKLAINARKDIGKDSPELQNFLDSKLPQIYVNPPAETNFKGSKAKEIFKAVRDSTLGGGSLLLEGIARGGLVGGIMAAAATFVNTTGEAEANLVHMVRKHDTINKINNLKLSAENYTNTKELREQERQEKINTTTLEEFLEKTPGIDKLNKIQLEAAFATKQKEVEARPEFAPPAERTNFEKAKSAIKAGAGYFVESQFGDLKELYSKDKEKTQDIKSPSPTTKLEPDKAKSTEIVKEKERQVQHMKDSLTHGNVTAYKSSISSPLATRTTTSHKKQNESSRG